ncbi:MAG: phage holin family protein [Chloroflexota bacterium]
MRKLFLRWLINALALFAAAAVVRGIGVEDARWAGWVVFALAAIVFGLVNALIRPLLKMLTCPLILLTLGLFTLVINALMLWLTGAISQFLNLGFYVDGFWAAFLGGLVVSIASVVLNVFVGDEEDERRRREKQKRR